MTNNPIDSLIPIQLALGGTNSTSFSVNNAPVIYDGTRLVTIASAGVSGQILTSNAASPPSFQTKLAPTNNIFMYTSGVDGVITGTGSTFNVPVYGGVGASTASYENSFCTPLSGTASNLYVYIDTGANTSTTNVSLTLYVNGSSTALTLTITALTAGIFSDTTHSVSISAGDVMYWRASAATVGGINGRVSMKFLTS